MSRLCMTHAAGIDTGTESFVIWYLLSCFPADTPIAVKELESGSYAAMLGDAKFAGLGWEYQSQHQGRRAGELVRVFVVVWCTL